jgi:hypothetical protein
MSNNKISKWTPEWEKQVTEKVGKKAEIEKVFKKGETKPDGKVVEKNEGEKVKIEVENDVKELFKEKLELKIELEKRKKELKEKSGYTDTYANLALKHDELEGCITEWETNLKSGKDYTKQHNSFLKSGTGITNPYRTKGWIKLVEDYNQKPLTGKTDPNDKYTNLHEGVLYTGNGNGQKLVKITEQEAVKIITRTIKEFGKIDKAEFKKSISTDIPSGVSIEYKKIDNSSSSNATDVETWLTTLQNHAKNLVEVEDAHTKRKEYQFGHNFVKDDGTGMVDSKFTDTEMTVFFEFVNFLHRNYNLTSHSDFQTKVIKDIPEKTELTFIPAKDEPYQEKDLHKWGVEGYTDNSFKNSTKKTGFYGDIPKKEWEEKAVKFEIDGKVRGWSQLIIFFFHIYVGGDENKVKIIDSFNDNPYTTLFDELRQGDEFGSFTNNTHNYTILDFPKFFYEQRKDLYRLKGLRDAELKRLDSGGEELKKAQEAENEARQAVKDKEKEIDDKIKEKKDELRKKLKEKFKIDNSTYQGFKKTSTEDNRLELSGLTNLIHTLKEIRFLENWDEEAESSVTNENTAFTEAEALEKKVNRISLSDAANEEEKKIIWANLFMTSGSTDKDRIEANKEFVEGGGVSHTWKDIADGFDELEKLIKLPDHYKESKKAIEKHMTTPDGQEKLPDWQSKLKALDPLITETVFTEEKMKDFQKHSGFKKVDGVVSLIKKVMDKEGTDDTPVYKVKTDFLAALKKEEAGITDLGQMFSKLEAEKIIKLIALFDYEKNKSEEEKKKTRRVYSWDRKKKVNDKFVDKDGDYEESNISKEDKKLEGDFVKFLYELATSKSEASISQPQNENGGDNDGDNQNQNGGEKQWWQKGFYWPFWTAGLLVVIGLVWYFRESIFGKSEKDEIESEEESEKDDE